MSTSLSMRLALGAFCISLFGGCASSPALQALVDAGGMASRGRSSADVEPRLDARFAYLRFERDRRVVYLALGYVDPHPEGAVEVWYSSAGEVLRLQDGRVVGSSGGETDWLAVSFAGRPAWAEVRAPVGFTRMRDVQPGYRLGLRERLTLRPIPAPADSRLQGVDAQALSWFEERVTDGVEPLPPSRYAVHFSPAGARVIYGEHCLSAKLCFSWQRWSATAGGAL
jgi:hypothetical protein